MSTAPTAPAPPVLRASAHSWWGLFVIFVAYTFSYIDRSILGLMVGPIKKDLVLTDTDVSLLTGLAFAICYVGVALPLASLSDHRSRRAIIAWAIAVWSLFTAGCGLASNFWQLFVARMGVGAGESVVTPAAYSLIADLFPKEQRGYAYGIYGLGNYIGAGLAYIVGGAVIHWVDSIGPFTGLLAGLKSWQIVFIAVAAPGIILILMMRSVPEPRVRQKNKPTPSTSKELFAFLRTNAVLLSGLFTAFGCSAMITLGFNAWGPAFYIRTYHLEPQQVGYSLGLTSIVFPIAGMLVAGRLLRYWTDKGHDDAPLRITLLAMLIMTPVKAISPLMPTWESALAVYALGLFVGPLTYVGGAAMLQLMTPTNLRAQISALYGFLITVLGMILGPLVIALFTDFVFRDEAQIGKSLALTTAIIGPIMCILVSLQFKRFRRAVRVLEGREQGE